MFVGTCMTRRGEGDHLVVEREARFVSRSQDCHCREGLHRTAQRDQSIWLTEACSESATVTHNDYVAAVC